MPASVSSSATVSLVCAPHISASALTTILATPVENLTVANFITLQDAAGRIPTGNHLQTLGSLFRTTPGGVSASGTKTVTRDASPNMNAARLTTILAIPVENLTLANLETISSALHRVPKAGDAGNTLGALFV